jgi:hypothetical protein
VGLPVHSPADETKLKFKGDLMSRRSAKVVLSIIFFLVCSPAGARVWVLHPDGSGDAPTIQAAIDSLASSDDIIELTDGIYTGDGNRDLHSMGKRFLLRSQSGNPADCVLDLQGNLFEWHWGIVFAEDG